MAVSDGNIGYNYRTICWNHLDKKREYSKYKRTKEVPSLVKISPFIGQSAGN